MNDLLFSLRTVFPMLLIMAAGFLARRLRWVDDHGVRQMNACVFRLFLPLLLFVNLLDTPVSMNADLSLLLYGLLTTVGCFALLFVLAPLLTKERRNRGVIIQGVCRSNYAIYGIPLVTMMFPDQDTTVATLMVAVAVPIFNIMSTIALMVNGEDERPSVWHVIKGILLNPLIIATALGLLGWALRVPVPETLLKPVRQMASIATPLALFALGCVMDFGKARANRRLLLFSVAGKLVAVPLVFLTIGILLGFRGVNLATLIALYASPVAVSSFPMAQQIGGNEDLAGGQVVFTTAFSIVTVFLWIFALKSMGFLL